MNIEQRIYNVISEMRKKNCNINNMIFSLQTITDQLIRYARKRADTCQFESGDIHNLITSIKTKIKKEINTKELNKILNNISYENLLEQTRKYDIITDKEFYEISENHKKEALKIMELVQRNTVCFDLFDIYFKLSFVCFKVRIFEEMAQNV